MEIRSLVFIMTVLFISCSDNDIENQENVVEEIDTLSLTKLQEDSLIEAAVDVVISLEAEFHEFEVGLYLNDPDPEGPTNVRDAPNGNVIIELPKDDFMLSVIGAQNGWLKIDAIHSVEEDIELPEGAAWIHSSVCAGDLRNYGGKALEIYEKATSKSPVVNTITQEEALVRIKDGAGDYVLIELVGDPEISGWIKIEWICGNPYTTCS